MKEQENMRNLEALARQDPAYRVWEQSYEASREAFFVYADAQPEEIRNFLYGYAESGRLMNQRLVNLACANMTFPEE